MQIKYLIKNWFASKPRLVWHNDSPGMRVVVFRTPYMNWYHGKHISAWSETHQDYPHEYAINQLGLLD